MNEGLRPNRQRAAPATRHARGRSPSRARVHGLDTPLHPILTGLLWVVFGLGSLATTTIALWTCISLARAASGPGASALWIWTLALLMTLGLPFALSVWQSGGDARKISHTMAWLPMVWNAMGLLFASQLIPDIVATALRGHGAWVAADRLGDTHSATRVLSALGHQTAEMVAPASLQELDYADTRPPAPEEVDESRTISVPMADGGIFVDTVLEGEGGRYVQLPYLFDTGASVTTISTDTAYALGIHIPDDAPVLTFNTASGPRESRMVYLPAVKVGQVRIEGLLVSVCDGCVNKRHSGLLGQNVMRRFFVQMDFLTGRTLLMPRVLEERPNRAYDIEPVVEMDIDGAPEVWLGRIRWIVTVENRGTVPIHDVKPVVRFSDGPSLAGKVIPEILPGATGRSLVEGKASDGRGNSKGHYQLVLAEAYW